MPVDKQFCRTLPLVALVLISAVLLIPSAASAAYTRPYVRQVTQTLLGPLHAAGVAVDAKNDLWIGEPGLAAPFNLNEFDPSGSYIKALKIAGAESTPPEVIAIEHAGTFFVTGSHGSPNLEIFEESGAFQKALGEFAASTSLDDPVSVAADNSSEASAGTVYVAHGVENPSPPRGDGLRPGIEKRTAAGEPSNFTEHAPYILGNQIIGVPEYIWESLGTVEQWTFPVHVAVDAHGDIYSVDQYHSGPNKAGDEEIDEYASTGLFIRTFIGTESPGRDGHKSYNGFGGRIHGIAVDPVSGHVLLSIGGEGVSDSAGVVDEFDASGHFLSQISEVEGKPLDEPREIATDSTGQLYVAVANAEGRYVVDTFSAGHYLPDFRPGEVSEAGAAGVTLNGSVDSEGLGLNECQFEDVPQSQFEATGFETLTPAEKTPCEPVATSIPADFKYHAVQAKIGGLLSGTTYRYRLLATTATVLGGASSSETLPFTAPHAPRVDSTSVDNGSSTFVDLHASIDPAGLNTTYRFEYIAQAYFEANGDSFTGSHAPAVAPIPNATIGSGGATGSVDAAVVQHIGGLTPDTTYRFRATAKNSFGMAAGEVNNANEEIAHDFTTLAEVSAGLPDGRAYELLTPPNKGSAEDMFAPNEDGHSYFQETDYGVAAESGDAFMLTTRAAFGAVPASSQNGYVFSRTASGWTYRSLTSPAPGVQNVSPEVYEPASLARVGVDDQVGSVASPEGQRLTTLVGPPTGPMTGVSADPPGGHNEFEELNTHIVGASLDLNHVVLESLSHTLAPGADSQAAGSEALYEWFGGGECGAENNNCRLVDVNSEGSAMPCGAILGQSHNVGTAHDAVSDDGSKVIFTAPDPYAKNAEGSAGCWNGSTTNAPQLYVRSGATTTEEVSAPNSGVKAGRHFALFVGASQEGSRIFFLSQNELTEDDEGNHDIELYEYDAAKPAGERLTRVSAGESGKAQAGVLTVPAISTDGSTVYFTAAGRLTAGAPETITEEEAYLYRYDTARGTVKYVTTVYRTDYPRDAASGWTEPEFTSLRPSANWYTTPDGRYLLFATSRQQGGYDTIEAKPLDCPEVNGGAPNGRCDEVYRYDSATGQVACVSCNPTGASPTSNASFADSMIYTVQMGSGPMAALSNDGAYAFFDTGDALVPQDSNGTLDVYEWHEGKLSLISSGTDHAPSFFLGASPDGANVFFGTHAQLVPADVDTAGDLYDARTGGGFAPPSSEGGCVSDACSSPPAAPIDATPGTLTFSGGDDLLVEPPVSVVKKSVKAPLTRAQLLAKALKTCRKGPRSGRSVCEKRARKRYGPKAAAKSKKAGGAKHEGTK